MQDFSQTILKHQSKIKAINVPFLGILLVLFIPLVKTNFKVKISCTVKQSDGTVSFVEIISNLITYCDPIFFSKFN